MGSGSEHSIPQKCLSTLLLARRGAPEGAAKASRAQKPGERRASRGGDLGKDVLNAGWGQGQLHLLTFCSALEVP